MDSDNILIMGIVTESYLEPLAFVLNPIQTASFVSHSAGSVLSEFEDWQKVSDAMMTKKPIKKNAFFRDILLIHSLLFNR